MYVKINQLVLCCLLAVSFGTTAQTLVLDFGFGLAPKSEDIAVDSQGNIYLVGSFGGTKDFDPGTGTTNLTAPGPLGDAYIAKYSPTGALLWAHGFTASSAIAYDVVVDDSDNVLVQGSFTGTGDFDPGAAVVTLDSSANGGSGFLLKMDSAGSLLWATELVRGGGPSGGLTVNSIGDVYSVGAFQGVIDFDPGAGVDELTSTDYNPGTQINPSIDVFITHFSAAGGYQSTSEVYAAGTSNQSNSYTVAIDSVDNLYVGGTFWPWNGADWDRTDVFVVKLNASAVVQWASQFSSNADDNAIFNLAADGSGNVYAVGNFSGTVDFEPGAGTTNLISLGGWDGYLWKLNASGGLVWVAQFGGTGYEDVIGLDLDSNGNPLISGRFYNTVDFDPGPGTRNLTSGGIGDSFVVKLTASGTLEHAEHLINSTGQDWAQRALFDPAGAIVVQGLTTAPVDLDPGTGVTMTPAVSDGVDTYLGKYSAPDSCAGGICGSSTLRILLAAKSQAVCGDAVIQGPFETCDDGNALACGTCSANCSATQPGGDCALGVSCQVDADCLSQLCLAGVCDEGI